MARMVPAVALLTLPLAAVFLGPRLEPERTFPSGPVDRSALGRAAVPVYWLGENHRGLPLTFVGLYEGSERVELAYGTCSTRGESCEPPLVLSMTPACQTAAAVAPRDRHIRVVRGGVAVDIAARTAVAATAAAASLRPYQTSPPVDCP